MHVTIWTRAGRHGLVCGSAAPRPGRRDPAAIAKRRLTSGEGFESAPVRCTTQTARSLRSLATCPVARTLYSARSMRPCASSTNVERMTPVTVLPYVFFSP